LKLEKAIQKLQDLKRYAYEPETQQAIDALQLGIEGLKRELEWRERYPGMAIQPLPRVKGSTKMKSFAIELTEGFVEAIKGYYGVKSDAEARKLLEDFIKTNLLKNKVQSYPLTDKLLDIDKQIRGEK